MQRYPIGKLTETNINLNITSLLLLHIQKDDS
jgi:hypothetical protein